MLGAGPASRSRGLDQGAARGTLPIRVLPFLEDAYHRQILRRVGRVYQFRHARIQDYLVMDRERLTNADFHAGGSGQPLRRAGNGSDVR